MKVLLTKTIKNGLISYKNKLCLILCISIFLFRLPPLLLAPISFIQTHNIARGLILILFVYIVIFHKKKIHIQITISHSLVIAFFLAQSLSIITSNNISSFIMVWKDICISLILYYITTNIISKNSISSVIFTLILSTSINLILQLLIYFLPSLTINLIQPFFYEKYWSYLEYQLGRNRFFGDSFDEVIIPVLVIKTTSDRNLLIKIACYMLIGGIVFITYISNWRTKTIVLGATLISSFIVLIKKKVVVLIVLLTISVIFMANHISLSITGTNIYDRFLLSEEIGIQTITGRITYWKEATDIGLQSPIFGVGLGNYFDNLSEKSKLSNMKSLLDRTILIDDPHNIFFSIYATTGFVGLVLLIVLLGYFIFIDSTHFTSINRVFILMFWGLFIFALFNPFQYASFLYLFWFLRGVIIGLINK